MQRGAYSGFLFHCYSTPIIFSLYDGQFSAPQALLSAVFIVNALVYAAMLPGLVLFLYRVIYLEVFGQKGSTR